MCLVCVRTVFSDTTSSRAIAGPSRSLAEQPQHVELALAQRVDQGRAASAGCGVGGRGRRGAGRCAAGDAARAGSPSRADARPGRRAARPSGRPRRRRPGRSPRARPARSARSSASSGCVAGHRRRCWARACSTRISMTVPIRPPASAAASSRSRRPVASRSVGSTLRRVLGEQDPGQGDVLVLAQVGQLVVGATRPGCAPTSSAAATSPDAASTRARMRRRPVARRARSRRRRPARPRRAGSSAPSQVALGLAQPGHRDPPPVRVLRQAGVLAELVGRGAGARRRRRGRRAPRRPGSARRACRPCPAAARPSSLRRARGRRSKVRCASPQPALGDLDVGRA